MSWTVIYPGDADVDGPAVRGLPDEFAAAAAFFETMQQSANEIVDEFAKIESAAGVDELQGQTAVAFAGVVADVTDALQVLPRVSGEAAGFLRSHVDRLGELRERSEDGVNSALARARTNWDARTVVQREADASVDTIHRYSRELSMLDGLAMTEHEQQRARHLEQLRSAEGARLERHQATVAEHTATLAAIRQEWVDHRTEEDRLSRQLDQAIDDIRLGELSDPGRLESIVGGIIDAVYALPIVGDIVQSAIAAVQALAAGDFGDFLWHLSDYLGQVVNILAAVAFVALVITGGPLLWLTVAVVSLTAAKMAVDTILFAQQTPHPASGEPMSAGTFAFNTISGALTIATSGLSPGARLGSTAAGAAGASGSTGAFSNIMIGGPQAVITSARARPVATVLTTASEGLTIYSGIRSTADLATAIAPVAADIVDIAVPVVEELTDIDFDSDLWDLVGVPGVPLVIPAAAVHLPRPVLVEIDIDVSVGLPTVSLPTVPLLDGTLAGSLDG